MQPLGQFASEIRNTLRALAEAPSRQECERRRDALCARLLVHVRTSSPIESIFSGVRLRTNASKRLRVRENARFLVFKLVLRLSLNWRGINAPNQLRLLLAGHHLEDGQLILEAARAATRGAASVA